MASIDPITAERLFRALGDLLDEERSRFRIVVVGGVALALGGFSHRTTADVDVIALAEDPPDGALRSPDPLPDALRRAVERVGRDFGLPRDWLNGVVGAQLEHGLPPALRAELRWRTYGGLDVGLAGRRALIALKLFAAADQGPRSKHVGDLVVLAPTREEWDEAREWVVTQDSAAEFPRLVEEVVRHVENRAGRDAR